MKRVLLAAVSVMLISSCSMDDIVVSSMADTMGRIQKDLMKSDDINTIERGLPANLLMAAGMLTLSPDNMEMRLLAAEMYCSYALGFVEDQDADYASDLYTQGRDHAIHVLRLNDDFAEAIDGGARWDEAVQVFDDPEDARALFWAGNCWGGWLNIHQEEPEALFDQPAIIALMTRVKDLDGSYYFYGVHLFFGVYYAKLPRMAGGSPEKSQEQFDIVFKGNDGKFLLANYFYAHFYCTLVVEEECFDGNVAKVLDTPSDIGPEYTMPNELAKRKARLLKEKRARWF